jgi:uncharacterized membrane protein YidH (DUF202 family)
MTRDALAQDRGLQAERTALAWTRTALAIAASGVLVLLRDGAVDLARDPTRLAVVAAVGALACGVFALGAHRRRQLVRRPRHSAAIGRRYLPLVGMVIIAEGALVVTYLAMPAGS